MCDHDLIFTIYGLKIHPKGQPDIEDENYCRLSSIIFKKNLKRMKYRPNLFKTFFNNVVFKNKPQ